MKRNIFICLLIILLGSLAAGYGLLFTPAGANSETRDDSAPGRRPVSITLKTHKNGDAVSPARTEESDPFVESAAGRRVAISTTLEAAENGEPAPPRPGSGPGSDPHSARPPAQTPPEAFQEWLGDIASPTQAGIPAGEKPVTVNTPLGAIRGAEHDRIRIFRGIPYAKPTSSNNRFAPPEPITPWKGVLDARKYGPMSYQSNVADVSEDSLRLNVWAPVQSARPTASAAGTTASAAANVSASTATNASVNTTSAAANITASTAANTSANAAGTPPRPASGQAKRSNLMPVYVFIHGGGYTLGSGSQPLYEGTELAKAGIVVVTLNYRLGPLGFFSSRTTQHMYQTTGNWGLLDMIEALRWVRQNIAFFGGDPNRVTIGGESAGAISVTALISSPKAAGLFQQAIVESGAYPMSPAIAPRSADIEKATELGSDYIKLFYKEDNAAGLQAMRALPPKELISHSVPGGDLAIASQTSGFWPIPDGSVIPADYAQRLREGNINKVALLVGYNTDESSLFLPPLVSEDTYRRFAEQALGSKADAYLEAYPVNLLHSARSRLADLATNATLRDGEYLYADSLSKAGMPVYAYHFDFVDPVLRNTGLGVAHGSELRFVFHNHMYYINQDPQAREVARQMYAMWTNFIKTGNPNGDGLPTWTPYTTGSRVNLRITAAPVMEPVQDWAKVTFINDAMYAKHQEDLQEELQANTGSDQKFRFRIDTK